MEYLIQNPHLIAKYLMYLTVVWFFIITVLGNKGYMISSLCILACVSVNIAWIELSVDIGTAGDYIYRKEFLIRLEGAAALFMVMFLSRDKIAWVQAPLLCFGILCHIMLILSIVNSHTGFFYNWYDELIITIGLLQMVVSYNGLRGAAINLFRGIQNMLCWLRDNNSSASESLHLQKERKAKV